MTSRVIWIDVQQYCIRDNEPHELKANDLKKKIFSELGIRPFV
jgi:hypothetical protein